MKNYFNFIYFKAHQNSGLFLGFGNELEASAKLLIGIVLPVIVVTSLVSLLLYKGFTSHATCLAWGLILGSGMSTIIERLKSGYVSNFILIDSGNLQSAIFNLADLTNLAGLLIIVFCLVFKKKVR